MTLTSMTDFYQHNSISPVRQDISDWPVHTDRRAALYRQLGILPAWVKGRTVLEVGPGSGYNSLYTASLNPKHYVLVEGNPVGVLGIKTLFARFPHLDKRIELIPTFLEDYQSQERFDFVFCEGVLGALGIERPVTLFERLMSFVAPGGVLVITCTDHVAWLPEMLRRLFAQMLIAPDDPLTTKVQKLLPVFSPHLDRLSGMSRRHDDWIIDNLISPASIGKLFTIPDAIAALPDDVEVYGASPAFLTDWRWYKSIFGADKNYNERALEQYWQNVHSFLNHREVLPPRPPEANQRLHHLCAVTREAIKKFELTRSEAALYEIEQALKLVTRAVLEFSCDTADALGEAYRLLISRPVDVQALAKSERFGGLFGRGQQYVSLSRR